MLYDQSKISRTEKCLLNESSRIEMVNLVTVDVVLLDNSGRIKAIIKLESLNKIKLSDN